MPVTIRSDRPGILRRLAAMLYETLLLFGVLLTTFVFPHVLIGAFNAIVDAPLSCPARLFHLVLVQWRPNAGHENLANPVGVAWRTPNPPGASTAALSTLLAKPGTCRSRHHLGSA